MKKIFMAVMTLMMAVFASCSNEDVNVDNNNELKVTFTVADKIGFGVDARAVKTGWEANDEILIAVQSEGGWTELGKYNCFKLKYNGSAWTTDMTGFGTNVNFESGNQYMAIYHPGIITLSGTAKDGMEALIGYKGGEHLQYIGTYTETGHLTFDLGTIKLERNPNDFQISVKGLASAEQADGDCKLYIYDASDESNSTGISYFGEIPALLTENGFATLVSPYKRSTGINYGDDVVFYFSNNGCEATSLKFVLKVGSDMYTYTTTTIPQGGKAYILPAITDDKWTKVTNP